MKKVLASASDPGGGNAILPVVQELLKEDHEVFCVIGGSSKDVFAKAGVAFLDGDSLGDEDLEERIKKLAPDIFISGTSAELAIEKRILLYCRKNKIPSLAVLDFWGNYWQRFSEASKDFFYLPDVVCVMDGSAKKEMLKEGFPTQVIEITGNPYFDHFTDAVDNKHEDKGKILFISQPFLDQKKPFLTSSGYDEYGVLSDVLEFLEGSSYRYQLIVRLHPKEAKGKFAPLLKGKKNVVYDDLEDDLDKSLSRAGVIIGMNSVVLFQASLAGKKVISYQPNFKGKDILLSNRLGLSRLITNKEELRRVFCEYFEKNVWVQVSNASKQNFIVKNATQNVLRVMGELIV